MVAYRATSALWADADLFEVIPPCQSWLNFQLLKPQVFAER